MKFKKFFFLTFFLFLLNCEKESTDINNTSEELNLDETNLLPQFKIDTSNKTIVDEPKIPASMDLYIDGELNKSYNIGIEIRGSSSQFFEKKSYGVETWDANNEDIDADLGGFPEEEDWILYGPFSDKSLIRNVLIFQLSNAIGMYGSRTDFYELTINDKFLGTYVLMEKIKRDKNRVNISKNLDDDISGGYIIKIDKPPDEGYTSANSFSSKYDTRGSYVGASDIKFLYTYPKSSEISNDQKNYIKNYLNDFEEALLSSNFQDPELGYQKYIDIDSFVDFLILNEISKNIDAYRISTFMHKDKNQKLKMGPIWDFNLGFGNVNYCDAELESGWSYKFNDVCGGDNWKVPFWWNRLFEDPAFVSKLKNRWSDLRTNILSDQNLQERIDKITNFLIEHNAPRRNFDKWTIIGKYVWPNNYIGNNYGEEISYLKNWLEKRVKWMDEEINSL
ncbi:MAG: hypothetical protein CMC88_09190 [Flavobacteriaceae bacterium]|nr:hypothetical protein [Flavobacteriaceae bacterium]|tara:strand:- start:17857 stop:19203 length:1347 start_codon:yes stop_codon:yes gene_type:complete